MCNQQQLLLSRNSYNDECGGSGRDDNDDDDYGDKNSDRDAGGGVAGGDIPIQSLSQPFIGLPHRSNAEHPVDIQLYYIYLPQ